MLVVSPWLRHGNSNLWFLIFLILVLVKPLAIPNANRYLGILTWSLVFGVFLSRVAVHRSKFRFERYKTPIALISGLFASYFISILVNLGSYPDFQTFVFRALAPLAVMSLFPMLWVILESDKAEPRWPVLLVLFALEALGAAQPFFPDWINVLRRHAVAADALDDITSLYRWHTILGTLSALLCVYGMVLLFHLPSWRGRIGYGLLALVSLVAGSLSHSRNFLLTLVIGIMAWLASSRQRVVVGLGGMLVGLGLFHAVAWFSPDVAGPYATALPYLGKLHTPSTIAVQDFLPQVDNRSLSNRDRIWTRAIELWRQRPWLGIGPGVFNLKSGFGQEYNAHNAFLQVLVDSGLIGLAWFLGLWGYLGRQTFGQPVFPLCIGAAAALGFDNFLDYSMDWVMVTTWLAYDLARRHD